VREPSTYLNWSGMGTYKAGEQNKRVLSKNNTGTYTVSLPIELVRQLKWQDGQKLSLEKRGKTIVITDWK
jgi:Ni/Co efflux regulator RcnB